MINRSGIADSLLHDTETIEMYSLLDPLLGAERDASGGWSVGKR